MPDSTKFPTPNPHPKDWVTVDPSKAPKAVTEHFIGRAVSPERKLNFSQVSELVEWFKTQPKAPPGEWYKEFSGFVVAGRGSLPLTVLTQGMHRKGVKLASKYSYGCVLAPVPPKSETAALLQEIRNQIDPEDLAGKGLDVGGDHITVRYGVEPEADIQGLIDYFLECEQFSVGLGVVDSFEPSKSSDNAAPLIIRIEKGKDKLAGINEDIGAVCSFTDPTFEYQPHITIAYVKAEAVDRYKSLINTEGVSLAITTIKINNVEEQGVAVDLLNPLIAKTADRPITQTDAFKSWFGNSKVVDDNGNPLMVYRGDYRGDQFGHSFNKGKSISGGFFFTDDPAIASNYATGKPDEHHLDANPDFANWFRFPSLRYKGEKKAPDMKQAWYRLSEEQKKRVEQVVRNSKMGEYPNEDEFDFSGGALANDDHVDRLSKQYRGNWLLVADDLWLSSGSLYNEERKFGKILNEAGLSYEYDDPSEARSTVTAVYLHIQNPIDTKNIPPNVIDRLRERAKSDKSRAKPATGNQWDKATVTLKDWVVNLEEDLKNNTTYAWTVLPDKVIDALQSFGYDGVKDSGGKNGGTGHIVWICFSPYQIKSAIGNNGKFDPMNKKITGSTESAAFNSWFSGSKIVDEEGKPLRVYHGTNQAFDSFDAERGGAATSTSSSTKGFWFTDSTEVASEYADHSARKVIWNVEEHEKEFNRLLKEIEKAERKQDWDRAEELTIKIEQHELDAQRSEPKGSNVMPVYLRITNPKVVEVNGSDLMGLDITGTIEQAKADGNDGVVFKNIDDTPGGKSGVSDHFVVFNSNQVKSAIGNNGDYDPSSKKITAAAQVDMGLINAIVNEMMNVLKPGLQTPAIKVVDQKGNTLGSCRWVFGIRGGVDFSEDNTEISLQKKITGDEQTLRRIIAHELAHHEDFLVNEKPEFERLGLKTYQHLRRGYDGHGPKWREIAERFNAKYGEGFVSRTSDADMVIDEEVSKPFFVLIEQYYDGKLMWQQASRLSPKAKEYLASYASGDATYPNKLFMTSDPDFLKGAQMKKWQGHSVPLTEEVKAKLQKLWDEGEDLLPQYAKVKTAANDPSAIEDDVVMLYGSFTEPSKGNNLILIRYSSGRVPWIKKMVPALNRLIAPWFSENLPSKGRYWKVDSNDYHAVWGNPKYACFEWDGENFIPVPGSKTAAKYRNPPPPRPEIEATPAFKAWFGNSKVTDLDGHPIIVYHGAPDVRFAKDIKDGVFKTPHQRAWDSLTPVGREKHQPAFFFAAHAAVARTYADDTRAFDYQNAEPGMVAVYLKIENPYVINQKGAKWHGTDSHVAEAYAGGHDGIIIKNSVDSYNVEGKPTDVYVVFKSNQIKSARDNSGNFDKDNPSILASVKPRKAAKALLLQKAA